MLPSFVTTFEINATYPPCAAFKLPWLVMAPVPVPVKVRVDWLSALSAKPSVEATRPPTLTCESAPNRTPFGFTRKT